MTQANTVLEDLRPRNELDSLIDPEAGKSFAAYEDFIEKYETIIQYQDLPAQFFVEDGLKATVVQTPLEMVLIQSGKFMMGSPKDELGRRDDEGSQHEVKIVAPFFMGKYPVTQAQWRGVADLPQIDQKLESAPAHFRGDNCPVEQVSWHDAVEFCARLQKHTGKPYRLPSEAEWEYACRAGTITPFHFGDSITTELANYRGTDWKIDKDTTYSGSYGDGPYGKFRQTTTDVGSFNIANAFGLCDMHGNVREWCLDHWHKTYNGAPTDGSAWITSGERGYRLLRGGSWHSNPTYCRSASRLNYTPSGRKYDFGFRVVCGSTKYA